MGNSNVPPPIDARVEKCMTKYLVPQDKIQILWRLYTRYDMSGSGYLSLDEFFTTLLRFKRSALTDSIPEFMGTRSDASINFGEFVDIICTFSCFEQLDLLKYIFYILDRQQVGTVEKHEFKHFFQGIWHHEHYGSLGDALEFLETIDDNGVYNFHEVETLRTRYPGIFYPIYEFQMHVLANTLGETWWENHKAFITETRLAKEKREANLLKKEKKEREKQSQLVSDEMLMKKMGLKYYFMPWTIARERQRLSRIAAIEHDLESQFNEMKKKV